MSSLPSQPDAALLPLTTRLPVLSVGYLLRRRWHDDQALRVHSCFAHALNLVWHDGNLCSVLSAPATAQPMAVVVQVGENWDWREHCAAGQWLLYRHGSLTTSQHWHIELSSAAVWEAPRPRALLDALPAHALRQVHALLLDHLRGYISQRPRTSALSLFPGDAWGIAVTQWNADTPPPELQRNVSALLGLGHGLTPDGDDYLLGYLAALHHCHRLVAHFRVMANAVSIGLARTTGISQHYLQLASQGHFSQSILILINSIATNPQADVLINAADRVMQYGASSGIDTLAGFLHGLRTVVEAVEQWDSARLDRNTQLHDSAVGGGMRSNIY